MSCRSRAKRVRSFSTASSAFFSCARTRSMLRAIICRMPNTASDAAKIEKRSETGLCHEGLRLLSRRVSPASSSTVMRRVAQRQQHHGGHRAVDEGRRAGLAERRHHDGGEGEEHDEVGQRRRDRRVRGEVVAVASQPHPDRHVVGAEDHRHQPAHDAGDGVAGVPRRHQRVEQEEQPDGGEPDPPAPGDRRRGDRAAAAHPRHASRQTRAVSLLIRHAAPSTKIASQATALTTAYQGSSWVRGARATCETPYIGVQ